MPAPLYPVKFTVVKGNAHFTGVAPEDGAGVVPADRTGANLTGVQKNKNETRKFNPVLLFIDNYEEIWDILEKRS